jgi:hypothetical protein
LSLTRITRGGVPEAYCPPVQAKRGDEENVAAAQDSGDRE